LVVQPILHAFVVPNLFRLVADLQSVCCF